MPRLVSVIVPVYNSSVLLDLADGVESALTAAGERYEILFVDDGSTAPQVWPTLEILATRPHVRAIQLTRNFGQHAATLCGLAEARGDVMVTMDDDLQHDPRELPRLLAYPDADVVIAQLSGKRHGVLKRLASRIKGVFDRLLIGKPRGVQLSSYRALSRAVVDGMLSVRSPRPFLPALMFHVSRSVVGVPVAHRERTGGRSGYTLRRSVRMFSNLVISNSSLLLRLVGIAGLGCAAGSVALATVVAYQRLAHAVAVPGWASLLAAQLLIGGFLLLAVGVTGEYLIRIIEASEARPTFFVRRRAGLPVSRADAAKGSGIEA